MYTCHICISTYGSYLCTLVDGDWGSWNDWSTCSASCGDGRSSRIRVCDSPLPQNGGSNCISNDAFVTVTDANGGIKEIASQTCTVDFCPGIEKSSQFLFAMLYIILK